MLVLALRDALVVAREGPSGWSTHEQLQGKRPMCLAADPVTGRIYCGTANDGVWLSDDAGESWRTAVATVPESRVTAVAVAPAEPRRGDHAVVYAGTEPSAVYRSDDGGEGWESLDAIKGLPSAPTWSFPPRPHTHHVRWLVADPLQPGRIFACIEAGALVRSDDHGRTWRDRVAGGPYDTHTLATHPSAPGRLYSAAGDGYFESNDAGDSWQNPEAGLEHHYLFGVAVDPSDPETVLVSAAPSPFRAYDPARAEAGVYRKSRGSDWQPVRRGLPSGEGVTVSVLAATSAREFWAANNRGVFRSDDAGVSWQRLEMPWPDAYMRGNVLALVYRRGNVP